MELTERCNNNCLHCSINLPENNRGAMAKELSTREVKDILRGAASLGCVTVRLTGGEPLLREDFEEIYLFARKLGLKVMLFTNATKITACLADLLARIPPLEKIEVTVYGMHKTSYEAVTRVPGSYAAAWRGINLLLERKIPFIVKGVLLPPTKKEVEEFEAWAKTIPWMDRLPSFVMLFDLRCRRDSEKKNRLIEEHRLPPEEAVAFVSRNREEYLRGMKEFCQKFLSVPGDLLFPCGVGTASGCVDAYGRFQPCLTLRHPETSYDLKKGSLQDAEVCFFPKIREMRAKNSEYLARCAHCFLKSLCEFCPAKAWMEHGTLDTPVEYLCRVTHAQGRYLGLLREGEMAWEVKDGRERVKVFTEQDRDES